MLLEHVLHVHVRGGISALSDRNRVPACLFFSSSRLELPRISGLSVLAHPDLALALVDHVLDPDLLGVILLKVANEPGVPQLRADAQVLAAPHQSVGLAALARRGDGLVAKVLALAAGLRDISIK